MTATTTTTPDVSASRHARDLPRGLRVGRFNCPGFWKAHHAGFFDPRPADLGTAAAELERKPIINGFGLRDLHRELDAFEQDLIADILDHRVVAIAITEAITEGRESLGRADSDLRLARIRVLRGQLEITSNALREGGVFAFAVEERLREMHQKIVAPRAHAAQRAPAIESTLTPVEAADLAEKIATVATKYLVADTASNLHDTVQALADETPKVSAASPTLQAAGEAYMAEEEVEECEHGRPKSHMCQTCIREAEDAAALAADNLEHGAEQTMKQLIDIELVGKLKEKMAEFDRIAEDRILQGTDDPIPVRGTLHYRYHKARPGWEDVVELFSYNVGKAIERLWNNPESPINLRDALHHIQRELDRLANTGEFVEEDDDNGED